MYDPTVPVILSLDLGSWGSLLRVSQDSNQVVDWVSFFPEAWILLQAHMIVGRIHLFAALGQINAPSLLQAVSFQTYATWLPPIF